MQNSSMVLKKTRKVKKGLSIKNKRECFKFRMNKVVFDRRDTESSELTTLFSIKRLKTGNQNNIRTHAKKIHNAVKAKKNPKIVSHCNPNLKIDKQKLKIIIFKTAIVVPSIIFLLNNIKKYNSLFFSLNLLFKK